MPKKEHQPGFIYIKSEALNQEIALSKKSGWVFCEDRHGPGCMLCAYEKRKNQSRF
jgi:hypothetical protein